RPDLIGPFFTLLPHQEVGLSYVLNTPDDRQAMLETIGVASLAELLQAIPESLKLKRPLNVPPALTEIELTQHMQRLAGRNPSAARRRRVRGGGKHLRSHAARR